MITWNVLRVVGQRERWVAAELRRGLGLRTYVPIERRAVTLRSRTLEVLRPLMPSYVFVGGVEDSVQSDVNATRHVIGFLRRDDDRLAAVADWEIDRIRELERQHNKALHDRRTFRAGDRVRAKDGPFASIDVLLRSIRGSTATIEVPMLGSTRTARVKLDSLEKVA